MIDEIQVNNVALIREATLFPSAGLTVLTGETGAGKTALLSACRLLMGQRADKSIVREGASVAWVSGRFLCDGEACSDQGGTGGIGSGDDASLSDGAQSAQAPHEIEEDMVVTRKLSAEGRSRASINGSMASVSELANKVAPMIDLVGQHDHQLLLKSDNHRDLLDRWAADAVRELLESYRSAFVAAQDAQRELDRVLEGRSSAAAQLDEARFILRQIDAVNPEPGELEPLLADLERAEHAETLARLSDGAYVGLSGDGGALDGLNAALSALEEGLRFDESLAPLAQSLREAGYILEDVAREALSYRDSVEFDADTLAASQQRANDLQGLMRTYGPRLEDVIEVRNKSYDIVSLNDDGELRESQARKAWEEAEKALNEAACALREVRRDVAPTFAARTNDVLAHLEMGTAELCCDVRELPRSQWNMHGADEVEFLFRPGEGMQVRPLARIASGGELSRVLLAIHAALGQRDHTSTLVFDEIDAGVGGATGKALAAVLADLACTHQVLVVTHLASVAVVADTHYVVKKKEGAVPETSLFEVTGDDRVAEIARMLSGDATQASLAHAKELLDKG